MATHFKVVAEIPKVPFCGAATNQDGLERKALKRGLRGSSAPWTWNHQRGLRRVHELTCQPNGSDRPLERHLIGPQRLLTSSLSCRMISVVLRMSASLRSTPIVEAIARN